MGIYRGPGGAGDATADASSQAAITVIARDEAVAAKNAAQLAASAAQLAETNAETAEAGAVAAKTAAESAASGVSTSASAAAASASSAATSATNAATSATNAASSASSASTSASTATTQASNASTSATNAASSASAANTSATNAASSASSASTSASNAATSATSASGSATSASSSASSASTSATNAASSATSAAGSATTATTQAGIATTQASNAAGSASSASTSATNAASSATNAASSATSAASAQTAAESARDATLAAYDSFDDRYLGVKASDPTLDNDGNALVAGALYFNSTAGAMKVYTGSAWTAAYVSGAGVLLIANNLSDLASAATARTNLGLGTAATTNSTAYATAAQGATADTAYADRYKWDGGATGLVAATGRTSLGLGSAATTASTDYATAAQGTKADTAYTDRMKWDGGATGLDAATGRTSLGLGTAATTNSTAYATAAQALTAGGTAGQILAKNSATNYDAAWIDNYATQVKFQAKNTTGSTITKGSVVYVSGAAGANPYIAKAKADAESTSATTVGVIEADVANNGFVLVVVKGVVSGFDTSAATEGDPVWLSPTTAGGMAFGLANKPSAPNHLVYLGTVTRAHVTQGEVQLQISNGWELEELHNVAVSSPTDGQLLTWEASTLLWKNKAAPVSLPSQTGNSGKYLTTDGTTASWSTVAAGASLSNDTSTSSNLYPLFAAATSGVPTTIYTSNSKYLYKPSTGDLQAPAMNAGIYVTNQIASSYTIPTGSNAMVVGLNVAAGVTLTVPAGSRLVVL